MPARNEDPEVEFKSGLTKRELRAPQGESGKFLIRCVPPFSDLRSPIYLTDTDNRQHRSAAVLNPSLCGPGLGHPSKVKAYGTITDY